jgi:hypothetical protein
MRHTGAPRPSKEVKHEHQQSTLLTKRGLSEHLTLLTKERLFSAPH